MTKPPGFDKKQICIICKGYEEYLKNSKGKHIERSILRNISLVALLV